MVSIQIETKILGDDCWWGLYNHEKDQLVAEGGEGYLSDSIYQYEYCLEEDVCTVMYLEGRNGGSDSIFEVTMKNETTKGKFAPEMERICFYSSVNCAVDIPDPFSGALKFSADFSLQLVLGSFIGLM